jgi:hypothetical protein
MTRALLLLSLLLTGCGPSGESFKGCAHHSINRTDGDLRDCGEKS